MNTDHNRTLQYSSNALEIDQPTMRLKCSFSIIGTKHGTLSLGDSRPTHCSIATEIKVYFFHQIYVGLTILSNFPFKLTTPPRNFTHDPH